MKLNKVLVFSELGCTLPELCSGANTLAEKTVAVVLGTRDEAHAAANFAAQVLWIGEKAAGSMAEDYVPALAELVRQQSPDLVLLRSTRRGKCIAGRLAVQLGTGVCSDVSSYEVADAHTVILHRMVYGGAASAAVRAVASPMVVLAASGSFDTLARSAPGEIVEAPRAPASSGVTCTAVNRKEEESVDLGSAKRVTGVGRGVGFKENIAIVEALAKKIGAEVACSRPIAEGEHWMSKSRYLGVSGTVVKPDVYIACGISGQVQHLVGVNGSRTIIAINKDKNAPIFKHCDYGIVGDLNKVIPGLTSLL